MVDNQEREEMKDNKVVIIDGQIIEEPTERRARRRSGGRLPTQGELQAEQRALEANRWHNTRELLVANEYYRNEYNQRREAQQDANAQWESNRKTKEAKSETWSMIGIILFSVLACSAFCALSMLIK